MESRSIHRHLIYDKGGIAKQWRKDDLFKKQCWTIYSYFKKWILNPYLKAYIKISSKWIVDCETVKLLEDNIGEYLHEVEGGKDVLNRKQKALIPQEKKI